MITLKTCQNVVEMSRAGIKACLFEDDNPQLALMESMIGELQMSYSTGRGEDRGLDILSNLCLDVLFFFCIF